MTNSPESFWSEIRIENHAHLLILKKINSEYKVSLFLSFNQTKFYFGFLTIWVCQAVEL